jgi:hypoxanthine phosphoribosyltransferase
MLDDLEKILFREETIHKRLDELAEVITKEYRDKELTVIAVLNGSIIFAADLLRRIPLPLKLDCVSVASYHGAAESTGHVTFDQITMPDVIGRHVLIVDDILDSGRTLFAIREKLLAEARPKSMKICVLLRKIKERAKPAEADYTGFDIADEFVVGYGLDYQERYRNLPLIGVLRRELIEDQKPLS